MTLLKGWAPTGDGFVNRPFFGVNRAESPVRFSQAERQAPHDVVYEVRVLRLRDGSTIIDGGDHGMPEFHEHRHAMLIDALVEVKRGMRP